MVPTVARDDANLAEGRVEDGMTEVTLHVMMSLLLDSRSRIDETMTMPCFWAIFTMRVVVGPVKASSANSFQGYFSRVQKAIGIAVIVQVECQQARCSSNSRFGSNINKAQTTPCRLRLGWAAHQAISCWSQEQRGYVRFCCYNYIGFLSPGVCYVHILRDAHVVMRLSKSAPTTTRKRWRGTRIDRLILVYAVRLEVIHSPIPAKLCHRHRYM